MTCDESRDRLDAFAAGLLDPAQARQVEDHLAGCAECRADAEASRRLAPLVAALPRSLTPDRDLWSGIGPRLRPRGTPGRVSVPVWGLVAAALLLVAGTSLATRRLLAPAASRPALAAAFLDAETRYLQTAAELAGAYARVRDRLPPGTRELVERNLAAIERALAETRVALDQDPGNEALAALVLSGYRRKLDFLERAATIDRES